MQTSAIKKLVPLGSTVNNRWQIDKSLGDGNFASVFFEVTDLERPIRTYVMKVNSAAYFQLQYHE